MDILTLFPKKDLERAVFSEKKNGFMLAKIAKRKGSFPYGYGCTLAWIEYSFYSLPLKNDLKSKSSSILNASINDACASYIHQFAKKKKEEIERENTNLEYSHAMKVL